MTDFQNSRRTFLQSSLALGSMGLTNVSAFENPVTPANETDVQWTSIRKQFLLKDDVIYMNNASLGLPPAPVMKSVQDGYALLSKNPLHGKHTLTDKIRDEATPALAKFLNVASDEIILLRNASDALWQLITSLKLEKGDEVIITSQEHPAGKKPWKFRAAYDGIQVKEVTIPSPLLSIEDTISKIESAITTRTKAIACCLVTRGGHQYPVREICRMARQRGITTIIDGAQAIGMTNIDLQEIACDAFAASLHKWILAPIGNGMAWINRQSRNKFRSLYDDEATLENVNYAPIGTADLPAKAAIADALKFINGISIQSIENRNRYLSDYLKSLLLKRPEIKLLSGSGNLACPGSTIFEIKGVDPIQEVARLEDQGIFIDEHIRDGHQALRISTHFYNSVDEIECVAKALGNS